ncbi:MAG: Hsp20/alpha crystallin family protein [Pirellulales bacterium]|nr:Hsp20/alpha crystallin family protein [Pirellulales bacterium]
MKDLIKKEPDSNVATVESTRSGTTYVPRFDIVETEDGMTLYGDMPGVTTEDLEVRFENEHLMIFGEVKSRHDGREHVYGEYDIGDYHREFQVNQKIDTEKISAELKNGVLVVHLPKAEALKPRKIDVKAG